MMPSPSFEQPGSRLEQLTVLQVYADLPASYRRRWPRRAWAAAREAVLEHARRPHPDDLDTFAKAALGGRCQGH